MANNFNRRKMRWLNAVMYCRLLSPTVCRVAYLLADHLNRATGDCWPAQSTIARRIGVSIKTIQRSVLRLEEMGLLTIRRSGQKGKSHHYAPVYKGAEELDPNVPPTRQSRSKTPDADVWQSYLSNLPRTYLAGRQDGRRKSDRGRLEMEIADRLGPDGLDVLSRLAEIDDAYIARLCEKQRSGTLSDEDLSAARLAAKQVRR